MESSTQERVLVTGASGYIACHVIDLLLRDPHNYIVRGTVRSLANPKKIQPLYDLAGEDKARLELVQADCLKEQGWNQAVKGCTYVLHLASPFPGSPPKHEDDLIKPAVRGTTYVFNASVQNGVKHIVVTSSIAAIMSGHDQQIYTSAHWTNVTSPDTTAYDKSKTLAQRQVRKLYSQVVGKIKLTTINPGFVLGPAFYDNQSTSGMFMRRVLTNDMPGIPDLIFGTVDVRDVAAAHILAIQKPNTDGGRYVLVEGSYHWKHILHILQQEFSQYGYKFPSFVVGKFPLTIFSWFDKEAKTILPLVGKNIKFDNSPSIKELGVKYIDLKKTLLEMAYRMIKIGAVPNKLPK